MPETLVFPDSHASLADTAPTVFACTLIDGDLDASWVHLAGELDIAAAPRLDRTLLALDRRARPIVARLVVLDLREVTFIDSCGVRVIVNASTRAQGTGCRLVVVRGPARVQRIFTLTEAADVLQIVDVDRADPAVQALSQLARSLLRPQPNDGGAREGELSSRHA